jgi:hypothetical protein
MHKCSRFGQAGKERKKKICQKKRSEEKIAQYWPFTRLLMVLSSTLAHFLMFKRVRLEREKKKKKGASEWCVGGCRAAMRVTLDCAWGWRHSFGNSFEHWSSSTCGSSSRPLQRLQTKQNRSRWCPSDVNSSDLKFWKSLRPWAEAR